MSSFHWIPSIDALLARPGFARLAAEHGREAAAGAARAAADALRTAWRDRQEQDAAGPQGEAEAADWIEHHAAAALAARLEPSLRRAINATGVILHTNLGRAPLAGDARARAETVMSGYSNLEYDLAEGARGHRGVHAVALLRQLTGAEDALVANNNAAATLVVLAALAAGREVLVSRGELVEIGGGFRVPEILAQSGATLREVGTTNRTRVADYAAAIGDRTGLILRVHPSNFRVEGFTERPALTDLAALARRFSLPLVEDLGSGWLGVEPVPAALAGEPSVRDSLKAGVDLVTFSGDKLLGGPQSGIVVGRRDLVDRSRRHPLMRAMRADKVTYALLEATLALWAREPARGQIPVYRMLTAGVADLDRRATALVARLARPGLRAEVVDGVSTVGGGGAPGSALPTRLIALTLNGASASALEAALRRQDPPVIARIHDDRVVLDLRTVAPEEESDLVRVVGAATAQGPGMPGRS